MSRKIYDGQGRRRNYTVGFRVSPEEWDVINDLVAMSGLTKQDYIMAKLTDTQVVVTPSTRVQKALMDTGEKIYRELLRLRSGMEFSEDLQQVLKTFSEIFAGLGVEEKPSEAEDFDDALTKLGEGYFD